MSAAVAFFATAACTVRERSCAEMPVVTPVCRLDRHGEGGAVRRLVVAHHQRQVELAAALLGQRQADQSAAPLGHEVDRFGRAVLGGNDEVAFVLAVFLVDQDHHAAGTHVGDDIENRADAHGEGLWRRKPRILRCRAGRQHPLDVTCDQVDFQINFGAGMQALQRRDFHGVRNQVDREAAAP
jgi:hypothetical protein